MGQPESGASEGPVYTLRPSMNLDGLGFTTSIRDVLADGKDTGIRLVEHTNGSKGGYKYTERYLEKGGEVRDLLPPTLPGTAMEWVAARVAP